LRIQAAICRSREAHAILMRRCSSTGTSMVNRFQSGRQTPARSPGFSSWPDHMIKRCHAPSRKAPIHYDAQQSRY
jgi:hypothetical protein